MASMKELQALANMVPGQNQKVASQQQAAQRIQARTAAAKAPAGISTRQVAQTLAPAAATSQAQVGQQAAAQSQQALTGLAQQGAQQQAFQGQQALAQRGMAQQSELAGMQRGAQLDQVQAGLAQQQDLSQQKLASAERAQAFDIGQGNITFNLQDKTRQDLAKIGNDIEDQLFTSRLQFGKDDRGRKFENARHLADYAIVNAKNEQEAAENLQAMAEAAKKRELIRSMAYDKIARTLQSEAKIKEAGLDAQTAREAAQLLSDGNRDAARARAKSKSISNITQAGMSILTAGAASGNPYVAAAGGAVVLAGQAGIFG